MLLAVCQELSGRSSHQENGSLSQRKLELEPGLRWPKLVGAWVWVANSTASWGPDKSEPLLSSLHHGSLEGGFVPHSMHWGSFLSVL